MRKGCGLVTRAPHGLEPQTINPSPPPGAKTRRTGVLRTRVTDRVGPNHVVAHVSVGREWGCGDAWVARTDSWNGRVSPRMGPTWYGAENFSATSINPFLC